MILGHGTKRKLLLSILILFLLLLIGCAKKEQKKNNDLLAIQGFLKNVTRPSEISIISLDRYIYDESSLVYKMQFTGTLVDNKYIDVLLFYDVNTQRTLMVHFSDMEAGYYVNEQIIWEEISCKAPDKKFSEEEITELYDTAQEK